MDLLLAWLTAYGDIALFLLLALGIVGLPGPDEILLLLAGYLAWLGRLGLPGVLIAGALGSMCGITVSYTLGRWIGLPLLILLPGSDNAHDGFDPLPPQRHELVHCRRSLLVSWPHAAHGLASGRICAGAPVRPLG